MKRIWNAMAGLALVLATAQPAAALQTGRASGSRIDGKTQVDRAIGQCLAAVLLGALGGTVIKKGKGTLIGAAAGGLVCAVLIKVASNKDKTRIRQAQLVAFNESRIQNANWVTDEGAKAELSVTPIAQGAVVMTSAGSIECRRDNQCRIGDSWFPKDQILAKNADPNAPKLVKASFESAQELVCRRNRTILGVDRQPVSDGSDTACLVGDTWVTGSAFKKNKIKESDVLI